MRWSDFGDPDQELAMTHEVLLFPAGAFLGVVVGGLFGALTGLENTGIGSIIGVAIGGALGGFAYAYHVERVASRKKAG
jgi:membrane associated rhomboid family serine protease